MRYSETKIVFQEIPDEISLAFLITGCQLRCVGCHSVESWNQNLGQRLDREKLIELLNKGRGWITCVLFMGGEWYESDLLNHLETCLALGFKTALYSGREEISPQLKERLHFLKTGRFIQSRGGLDSPSTNQILIDVKTGENLNYKFQKFHGGPSNDSTQRKSN